MLLGRYIFNCVFQSEAVLPGYKGSTVRGVFGRALKSVVCALRCRECLECLLSKQCLYAIFFENIGEDRDNSLRVTPPYVIEPPYDSKKHYSPGDPFVFTLLLFGKYNESLPYFIYAMEQMGTIGIGKRINGKAAKYTLESVFVNGHNIYSSKERVFTRHDFITDIGFNYFNPAADDMEVSLLGVRLITPLRVKYHNHLHLPLPFHILVRASLRRVSHLYNAFGEGEPPFDYPGMVSRAQSVQVVKEELHWHDWQRFSLRQEQKMLMGGVTGYVVYEGNLGEFLPLLRFCEQVHIGKQTTFGLGKIELFYP